MVIRFWVGTRVELSVAELPEASLAVMVSLAGEASKLADLKDNWASEALS